MFRKTVFALILSAAAAVAGAKNPEYAGLYSTPSGGGVRLTLFPNGSYCLKTEGQAQSERGRYQIRAAAVRLDNGQFLIRSTEREAEEMGDDSHTYFYLRRDGEEEGALLAYFDEAFSRVMVRHTKQAQTCGMPRATSFADKSSLHPKQNNSINSNSP